MIDLALTGAALGGEPWRLWTGHLVHWGMEHLALNLVAMLPPLLLLRRREAGRIALWLLAAAPLVSVPILLSGVAAYRGASGLVVGFWCAAALALQRRGDPVPALAFLGLVAAKVSLEASGAALFPHDGYFVVPLAHQAGALLGLAIGSAVWFSLRKSEPEPECEPGFFVRRQNPGSGADSGSDYRIRCPGNPISSVSFVSTHPTTSPGTKSRGR
ncbi:MAG TPA: rhomboid family intramembrane serine protease [Thermoanaerobaculia bacterium]